MVGLAHGLDVGMRLDQLRYAHVRDAYHLGFVRVSTRAHVQRTITHGVLKKLTQEDCPHEVQRTIMTTYSLYRIAHMYKVAGDIKLDSKRKATRAVITRLAKEHRNFRPDVRITVKIGMHPHITKHKLRHLILHVLRTARLLPARDINWLMKQIRVHVQTGSSVSDVLCNVTKVADDYVKGQPRA